MKQTPVEDFLQCLRNEWAAIAGKFTKSLFHFAPSFSLC
jgi:hypothetical protein